MEKVTLFYDYTQRERDPKFYRLVSSLCSLLDGIFGILLIPFNKYSAFSFVYSDYALRYQFNQMKKNNK